MKKNELVEKVSEKSGHSKGTVLKITDAFIRHAVAHIAKGRPLCVSNFGSFETTIHPERSAGTVRMPKRRWPTFFSADNFENAPSFTDTELINLIAADAGLTIEQTQNILNLIFATIRTHIMKAATKKVSIDGFGTLRMETFYARTLIDPDTGVSFSSQQQDEVVFTSSAELKHAVELEDVEQECAELQHP